MSVLAATGISVSFGGVHAVVDVGLDVGEGRLVGLIGPNGAGRTTFIDAISGFVRSRGSVQLDGHDLTRLPPHARARRGLARTWQSIELFDDLSVRENLFVASHRPSVWRTIRETVSKLVFDWSSLKFVAPFSSGVSRMALLAPAWQTMQRV